MSGERLPADASGAGACWVAGGLVERLGGTSHLHVEVGLHRLMASVSGEHWPEVGDLIELQVPPARVHLFGGDGRSIS